MPDTDPPTPAPAEAAPEQVYCHCSSETGALHLSFDSHTIHPKTIEYIRADLYAAAIEAKERAEKVMNKIVHPDGEKNFVGLWVEKSEENDRLRTQLATATAKLRAMDGTAAMWESDARTILAGFEEDVFVRSTKGDDDSAWAIKLMPYITALARLQERCDRIDAALADEGDGEG